MRSDGSKPSRTHALGQAAFTSHARARLLLIGPCLFTCGEQRLPQIRESP